MLIENDLMGRNISQSIVGIGININQEAFHGAAPNPVSIYQITGKQYDIFEILKNIMLRIQSYYCQLKRMIQHQSLPDIQNRFSERTGCIDTKMLTESSLHRLYV